MAEIVFNGMDFLKCMSRPNNAAKISNLMKKSEFLPAFLPFLIPKGDAKYMTDPS